MFCIPIFRGGGQFLLDPLMVTSFQHCLNTVVKPYQHSRYVGLPSGSRSLEPLVSRSKSNNSILRSVSVSVSMSVSVYMSGSGSGSGSVGAYVYLCTLVYAHEYFCTCLSTSLSQHLHDCVYSPSPSSPFNY
jgi:hypothetical protein